MLGALTEGWLPTPRTVLVAGPALALYAIASAAVAAWFRTRRGVAAPYTRKIFHFLIFSGAGLAHLLRDRPGAVLFGVLVSLLVLFAAWRGDGHPLYEALARPSDAPRRTLFVLVPLATTALGGVAANLLFPAVAPVGYMVCGWGDAVAEPVGERWGRHRYRVPSLAGVPASRSVEGSASVLVVGGLAAAATLAAMGTPAGLAVRVGLLSGAAATAVEAVSNHGIDNFTVQLSAAAVAAWLL